MTIVLRVPAEKKTFVERCQMSVATNMSQQQIKHLNEANPKGAPAIKAKLSLNKSLYPELQHLFRNVHVINIKWRPLTDCVWQKNWITKGSGHW